MTFNFSVVWWGYVSYGVPFNASVVVSINGLLLVLVLLASRNGDVLLQMRARVCRQLAHQSRDRLAIAVPDLDLATHLESDRPVPQLRDMEDP